MNQRNQTRAELPANLAFWWVEGSLLELSAASPLAFFTSSAQTFAERWQRRSGLALLALLSPFLRLGSRVFAKRALHTVLRGVSRDRLDLLGEEYFHYVLKPRLDPKVVRELKEVGAAAGPVVLASQGLDHIVRPLAEHVGVSHFVANRLEFRDGLATGRLLDPVLLPRRGLAPLASRKSDGNLSLEELGRELRLADPTQTLLSAVQPAQRRLPPRTHPLVWFEPAKKIVRLSVRRALAGKHILLIGATGFIGKVWLAKLLSDLPEVGRIYLLIRRQRSISALRRFERIVEESPVFDPFYERHGEDLARFLSERIEVVEGDVCQPGLGLDPETRTRLARSLDLVVNSAGLTDFNPDLREGLATNVEAALNLLDFLRQCDHAALLHLSTCYVVGARDGRVYEDPEPNYTPAHVPNFDAEQELAARREQIKGTVARAESPELTAEFRREAVERTPEGKQLTAAELDHHIRRYRSRWLRTRLTQEGVRRAQELGWPNTYTFTKSLAESLIATRGAGLPVAVVRPSIVETSLEQPFRGWNEGINTSAPLSYLLGTYFRQLPSNERKCLDLIPVDVVARGMTLVAAALVERRHQRLYQLATSACNPCNMRRSIELTSLAHRKHYRAQKDLEHWLRAQFDAIPVSKTRYQRLSAPGQKRMVRFLKLLSYPLPFLRKRLERRERNLERVEKLIELYEPFILLNEHVFVAENVEFLSAALPPEEKPAFAYDADSIDWWEYWINIHVPALRKWVYPLIEGRPPESRPRRSFRLLVPSKTSAAATGH